LQGYNASLVKDKKRDFIPYGFHIGFYMVRDTAHVKQEGLNQLEYQFHTGRFHKHDPKGLVPQHVVQVSSYWPYAHDNFEDEIFTEGAQDWEEVLQRRANLNMTKFKVMSLDEQVETIEQTTQEALRVRDERRTIEATEAQRRGMLLLEEAQRAIQRLEQDPPLNPLIEPLRITPINTSDQEVEPNGSSAAPPTEIFDREETVQVRSPITTAVQQRPAGVSSGTGVPTILVDLITIYDDDEGSEVSHISLVVITQEEIPGEVSSLAPDEIVLEPREGDQDARITTDVEFLSSLETQLTGETQQHGASSKYDMDMGEQGGTMKLPEIGTPPAEPSIGTELPPTPSSGVKTQLIIETRQDDQPTEHPRNSPAKEPSGPNHETKQEPT
jgi:hypothetical protein